MTIWDWLTLLSPLVRMLVVSALMIAAMYQGLKGNYQLSTLWVAWAIFVKVCYG